MLGLSVAYSGLRALRDAPLAPGLSMTIYHKPHPMSEQISGTEPILCAPLLRGVDAKLIELLRDLRPDEWDLQTIAPAWKVRDVAAHLLDTVLRKLSMVRDRCFVEN